MWLGLLTMSDSGFAGTMANATARSIAARLCGRRQWFAFHTATQLNSNMQLAACLKARMAGLQFSALS